ncbi:type II secretion system F family protein [Candidatus Falkowbacteria bacterium]|nr:type II secretion system F family protein [Candidatus Falkowbacteria bacterium]
MKFKYIAFDSSNRTQKGKIEAPNLKEATKLLLDQGWYIKKINTWSGFKANLADLSFGGVSLTDKALFVRHLGTMIKSGININEALEVIADQASSPKFKRILNDILDKIKTGQSLARALSHHKRVFDPFFVNIIKVGEESGTLEENLDYLADEMEDRIELKRNIRTASFYPAIVFSATIGLGIVLAYFVLPKITRLFSTLNFELPITTKILLGFASAMDKFGVFIVAGSFIFLVAVRILISLKPVKPYWHLFLIKLPIVGGLLINYNLVLFSRTLNILLKSGLTIDQALMISIETTSNVVYRKKLKIILPKIQKGKNIADVLTSFKQSKRNPLFPLIVIKMIGVGERSGNLAESLKYLADYFQKEVDHSTKNLTTVLEPILLLTVGLIVGFVAISVIAPIYQVTGQFQG